MNASIPQSLDSTKNKLSLTQGLNQFPGDSIALSVQNKKQVKQTKTKQTLGALGAILIITAGSYFLFYTRSK